MGDRAPLAPHLARSSLIIHRTGSSLHPSPLSVTNRMGLSFRLLFRLTDPTVLLSSFLRHSAGAAADEGPEERRLIDRKHFLGRRNFFRKTALGMIGARLVGSRGRAVVEVSANRRAPTACRSRACSLRPTISCPRAEDASQTQNDVPAAPRETSAKEDTAKYLISDSFTGFCALQDRVSRAGNFQGEAIDFPAPAASLRSRPRGGEARSGPQSLARRLHIKLPD